MNFLEIFVNHVYPLFILIVGLIGNLIGFITLSHKKLEIIGPRIIYKYLMVTDSVYLIHIIHQYLKYSFKIDITLSSVHICRLVKYFTYSTDAISPALLIYISIERVISIKYSNYKLVLRSFKSQYLFLISAITFNLIIYLAVPFLHDLNKNQKACDFYFGEEEIYILDLINLICLPFFLMVICSSVLIYFAFKLRRRILNTFLNRDLNKTYRKDIKLSIVCLSLNLLYLSFALPFTILNIHGNFGNLGYRFALYLFFTTYACSFYTIVATNSLFRKEVKVLLRSFVGKKSNRIIPKIIISDMSNR